MSDVFSLNDKNVSKTVLKNNSIVLIYEDNSRTDDSLVSSGWYKVLGYNYNYQTKDYTNSNFTSDMKYYFHSFAELFNHMYCIENKNHKYTFIGINDFSSSVFVIGTEETYNHPIDILMKIKSNTGAEYIKYIS